MVSDKYLKNYARKIYEGIPGYSFQRVAKLAPSYLPAIQYYYDLIRRDAEDNAMNNLRSVVYFQQGLEAITYVNQYLQTLQALRAQYDKSFADYKDSFIKLDELRQADWYPDELKDVLYEQELYAAKRSRANVVECRARIRGLKVKMDNYLQVIDQFAYNYGFADISNRIKQARDFLLEDITGE